MQRDYTRFVILTQARTGSNMLVSTLNSHSMIQCFGEILNPASLFGYENWRRQTLFRRLADKFLRDYNANEYICRLQSKTLAANPNIRAFGYKVIYPGQFDRWPGFRCLWRTQDKIIALTRQNLLRKYISSVIANTEGVWSTNKSRNHKINIRIDLSDFWNCVPRIEAIYKIIDTITMEFRGIRVTYEDLTSERRSDCLRTILGYLGVNENEASALMPKTARQNPQPLEQLISNFTEIQSALKDTPYVEWLE